jgi:pullulanase/glycogen debranching enzyme
LLRLDEYLHGSLEKDNGLVSIEWFGPGGEAMDEHAWSGSSALCFVISENRGGATISRVAVILNGSDSGEDFILPGDRQWRLEFASTDGVGLESGTVSLAARSVALAAVG